VSLPEITDEDRAVQAEALRLYVLPGIDPDIGIASIAAALVRTGWKPVDPDLILAREVAADVAIKFGWAGEPVNGIRRGDHDDTDRGVQSALAAINAAVQRERERKG